MKSLFIPQTEQINIPQNEFPPNYIFSEEWHRIQYHYLKIYMKRILDGWSVADFFDGTDIDKIAVYAMTDFAEMAVFDLRRRCQNKIILSDGKPENHPNGQFGYMIYTPDQLYAKYRKGEVRKVLVCSIFHANEIMQNLLDKGFDLSDLVTIKTALLN